MSSVFAILLVIALVPRQLSATKFDDTKRLEEDLMTSYNRDVRPTWDDDDVTKVAISLALVDIEDIMLESGHMKSRMWTRMEWIDPSLRWNPDDYNDVTELHITSGRIWRPDVRLYNAMTYDIDKDSDAVVTSDGRVNWVTSTVGVITCHHEFRTDSWMCPFSFLSWTHDGKQLDLSPLDDVIDMTQFAAAERWNVLGRTTQRQQKQLPWRREAHVCVNFIVKLQMKTGRLGR